MESLQNERGIALVTSLLLTLITLIMVTGLLSLVTAGIQNSSSAKRYKNVVEAGYGGISLSVNEIIPGLNSTIFGNLPKNSSAVEQLLLEKYGKKSDNDPRIDLKFPGMACLQRKLDNATGDWGPACGSQSKSLDPKTAPDFSFTLKSSLRGFSSTPGFIVYGKIVDTLMKGNTDKADRANLRKAENVIESESIESTGLTIPTTYRIEIRAESETNIQEKADISVLYAY